MVGNISFQNTYGLMSLLLPCDDKLSCTVDSDFSYRWANVRTDKRVPRSPRRPKNLKTSFESSAARLCSAVSSFRRVKDCTYDNRCRGNYLLSISSTLQYLLPQCYHPRAFSSSLPVEAMDLLVDHFSAFHIGIHSFRLDLQLYICPQASLQTDQV